MTKKVVLGFDPKQTFHLSYMSTVVPCWRWWILPLLSPLISASIGNR